MSNSIFRRYTGKELSEDEAAFIAIHIQSILEENHDSIKLVIVCSSGIGISQLLATRVEKIFPNVVIVAVESVYSFSQRTHKDIDLVLSTFPVETSLPVLRVSPLLNDKDVQLIENFIKHYRTSYDSLFNYVQIETFLQKDWNSQEQIIHEVATTLEYKGLVTPEFKEEIHKREMINSTAIGMLVALPHATFGTVIATHLSIVTLTKPVLWGEDMVDLVVFIAITERDASWVPLRLRNIYYKFYSEETHNRLLQKTSKTEIINILTE